MSQTDKAFIKAFRHGPSAPRPVRRPVAAPVEERPVAAVAAASSAAPAAAAGQVPSAAPQLRTPEPAPTASSLPPVSPSVDEGPESDRHLPVIERDEDERPGEPILSFEEARLLRGDAPVSAPPKAEAPSTATSVAPPAKPEIRSAASAAPPSPAPAPKPAAEAKERPLPTEPKEVKAATASLASAGGPLLQVPKPTLASAKPAVADVPPPRAVRGLHLRTLADFTEEASAEEPWAVRRKVESFEMPGVCQSLLAARGEDFHRLAQELHARREKGLKTLWVGSCQGNEGATSFAVCLAHVLGKQGVHTALVDHDLTNPGVADMLHLNPDVGWREVLAGESALPDALWESADGWSVLPLRPDNAAPLSGSQLLRLRLSMALLRRQFDLVLLDAGPFRLVGDEEMTYPQPDAAILVYDPQATTAEELGKQADRLVARQIDLLGAVENFSLQENEGKVA